MSERLKPCPFCNGHAKIDTKRESAGMDGSYTNWIIHCEKCGAMITCPADGFYGRKALTEDEAIEAWNRRASDALSQPEIIRCGECIYYDPPHVENNGVRYEYTEMPEDAFDVLGTGLVTAEYGINVGGRCCRDYNAGYDDDKRVYVPENNYCGRAERRTNDQARC